MINNKEIRNAVNVLRNAEIDASDGLDNELFWAISALTPIPNVDLLIVNDSNQILLTRRDDVFYGRSWHIPGGCIRFGEEFSERIQQTALNELRTTVDFDPVPIAVRNVLRGENPDQPHPKERGHNIAILFKCQLPDGYVIDNGNKTDEQNGFIKWFDVLPDDFLAIQHIYDDILKPWRKDYNNG